MAGAISALRPLLAQAVTTCGVCVPEAKVGLMPHVSAVSSMQRRHKSAISADIDMHLEDHAKTGEVVRGRIATPFFVYVGGAAVVVASWGFNSGFLRPRDEKIYWHYLCGKGMMRTTFGI